MEPVKILKFLISSCSFSYMNVSWIQMGDSDYQMLASYYKVFLKNIPFSSGSYTFTLTEYNDKLERPTWKFTRSLQFQVKIRSWFCEKQGQIFSNHTSILVNWVVIIHLNVAWRVWLTYLKMWNDHLFLIFLNNLLKHVTNIVFKFHNYI